MSSGKTRDGNSDLNEEQPWFELRKRPPNLPRVVRSASRDAAAVDQSQLPAVSADKSKCP